MKNVSYLIYTSLFLSLICSAPSIAQDRSLFLDKKQTVSVSIGIGEIEPDSRLEDINDGFFFGFSYAYQFAPYWQIEAGYLHSRMDSYGECYVLICGGAKGSSDSYRQFRYNGNLLAVKRYIPVSNRSAITVKAGVHSYDYEFWSDGRPRVAVSDNDLFYGLGWEFRSSIGLGFGFEYQKFYLDGLEFYNHNAKIIYSFQ